MPGLDATVIVRAKDSARTIERALESLRRQSVRPEILVVDSGSTDGTLDIAYRLADRVVQIVPEEFTFGRALNVGAREASGAIHFALSSHCHPADDEWVALSLAHFERPEVAGVCGLLYFPDGRLLTGPFDQDAEQAHAHPEWGFSTHGASWRGSVWQQFPFDENLPAAEDREWSWRALEAGYSIVCDPAVYVDWSHKWNSAREAHRRARLEWPALTHFATLPRYGMGDMVREWWTEMPDHNRPKWFHRLNYRRWAELIGKYQGLRVTRSA
jgi:rhamnosyltransferase